MDTGLYDPVLTRETWTMAVEPVPEVARAFGERMRERFGERLREVKLFGSYARGTARESSDIDVLAVVTGLTRAEKIEAIELAAEIGLRRGVHLSPLVWSDTEQARLIALELRLALDIEREGLRL